MGTGAPEAGHCSSGQHGWPRGEDRPSGWGAAGPPLRRGRRGSPLGVGWGEEVGETPSRAPTQPPERGGVPGQHRWPACPSGPAPDLREPVSSGVAEPDAGPGLGADSGQRPAQPPLTRSTLRFYRRRCGPGGRAPSSPVQPQLQHRRLLLLVRGGAGARPLGSRHGSHRRDGEWPPCVPRAPLHRGEASDHGDRGRATSWDWRADVLMII